MRNFVSPGAMVTFPAPAGGLKSGDGIIVGSLFGIAASDALAGADVECLTAGVVELPSAAQAFAFGAKVYWNTTNETVTTTATGNTLIGVAARAAATTDPIVRVRLNGVSL